MKYCPASVWYIGCKSCETVSCFLMGEIILCYQCSMLSLCRDLTWLRPTSGPLPVQHRPDEGLAPHWYWRTMSCECSHTTVCSPRVLKLGGTVGKESHSKMHSYAYWCQSTYNPCHFFLVHQPEMVTCPHLEAKRHPEVCECSGGSRQAFTNHLLCTRHSNGLQILGHLFVGSTSKGFF